MPWEETERRIVEATGSTRALIHSTGVGDPIVERLQQRLPNVEGQKFTPASKQQLMEGLAVAIQAREVSFPEGPITAELLAFEYQYSRTSVPYAAPEGMHDDCVDALALAVRRRTRPGTTVWDLVDAWGQVEHLSHRPPTTEPERAIGDSCGWSDDRGSIAFDPSCRLC